MREPYLVKFGSAVRDLAHPRCLSAWPEYDKLDGSLELYWACCKELGGAHLVLNYDWADCISDSTLRQRNKLIGFWVELNKLRQAAPGWAEPQAFRSLLYRILDEFENLC